VLVTSTQPSSPHERPTRQQVTFTEDFKRFFLRGLAALLPTLITLSIIWYILSFLWESIGQHLIYAVKWAWVRLAGWWFVSEKPAAYIREYWSEELFRTKLVGVLLAIVLVYIVGLLVGNLIGRTFWRAGEALVMKIPLIRAIYPAVKQVTDFVLAPGKARFEASRVVAVQPHERGIWSIGLVTGAGLKSLDEKVGEEMVMVFLPNSPAAFSGYVLVVPRSQVVDLPLSVEEAMRLFVSGGVILPGGEQELPTTIREAVKQAVQTRRIEAQQQPGLSS
jgi:uncharacterized membrane protein